MLILVISKVQSKNYNTKNEKEDILRHFITIKVRKMSSL